MNADGTAQTRLTNTPATDVEPAWPPFGAIIAFASNRDGGDFDVFTMSTSGTNVTQETTDPSDDRQPAWLAHPTNSVLAFVRNGDVFRTQLGVAGSETNLTSTPLASESHPNWSPVGGAVGGRIAWDSDAGGDREIEAADGDGSNVTPLTTDTEPDVEPAWSPTARGSRSSATVTFGP